MLEENKSFTKKGTTTNIWTGKMHSTFKVGRLTSNYMYWQFLIKLSGFFLLAVPHLYPLPPQELLKPGKEILTCMYLHLSIKLTKSLSWTTLQITRRTMSKFMTSVKSFHRFPWAGKQFLKYLNQLQHFLLCLSYIYLSKLFLPAFCAIRLFKSLLDTKALNVTKSLEEWHHFQFSFLSRRLL